MSFAERRPSFAHGLMIAAALLLLSAAAAPAVPFRPDVLASLRSRGALDAVVAGIRNAETRGLDRPSSTARGWLSDRSRTEQSRDAIVILVDFSDNPADQAQYPPSHFNDMLFSVGSYPTGSMADYYLETSYGTFHLSGQATVWLRMPQSYAYYVDGQAGFGTYPHNAQKLAEDAVVAADPYIDFSHYDNDGPDGIPSSGDDDGLVDALFVVHAGPGREESGSNDDIHSHSWSMANPVGVDGVTASGYTMEPENGTRGVFCHEFGHALGLPDLYDTDYSSLGVGDWCVMGFGSWGGGGLTPTHFMSWCKMKLGFLDPVTPLVNGAASLAQAETNPAAYRLWTGGYPASEYFMVENRQRIGTDISLPGGGLVICHIDESVTSGNTDENHPLVMVEQADGLNGLAHGFPSDAGDPWPGSANNRNFTPTSNPNSNGYNGADSQVAVNNISDSGPVMTASVVVETLPLFALSGYDIAENSGNGDGDIDPGEQFSLPVTVRNLGLGATQVSGTITSSPLDLVVQNGASSYGDVPAEAEVTGAPPFRFSLLGSSTRDGLPIGIRVSDHAGHANSFSIILGVNDPLQMFRWTHAAVFNGFGDQWHLGTESNHTPGGQYSWKCGATGSGTYANSLDAGLVTTPLPLPSVQAVRFWHRIDAEDDANQTAWDGGICEVSIDGGPFTQITPDGGYPFTIIPNPASPFPGGTPCFSGTFGWSEVRISLAGLSGSSVRLRFRFGSDGYVGGEGWFIDDVTAETTTGVEGAGVVNGGELFLSPASPNPSSGAVAFTAAWTRAGAVLTVTDVQGRLHATIPLPAGAAGVSRNLVWDGRDESGRRVPGGVYYLRLSSGREERVRAVTVVR